MNTALKRQRPNVRAYLFLSAERLTTKGILSTTDQARDWACSVETSSRREGFSGGGCSVEKVFAHSLSSPHHIFPRDSIHCRGLSPGEDKTVMVKGGVHDSV